MAGVALRDRYTGGVLVVDKAASAALLGGRRYTLADAAGVSYDKPNEAFAFTLMDVCRGVANRLMPTDGGEGIPQGVTSYQQTAGPYSGTYTFASSFATPRLTRQELRRLGIGLITTIDLTAGA